MIAKVNNSSRLFLLIAFLLIMIFSFSCKTKNIITSKTHTRDSTTIITERAVPIYLKGDSSTAVINKNFYDSILTVLQGMNPGSKIVYKKDPNSMSELSFYKDQFGKLVAVCESKDSVYQAWVKDTETRVKEKDEIVFEKEKTFKQQIKDLFFYGIICFFIFLIVVSILLFLLWRLKR